MEKERIYWIDWVKTISIYAVVLVHLHITETIRESLLLWVNGLFFLISGYLYKKNTFKKEVIKSVQSIFVPFLIYAIGITLLYMAKSGINYDFSYNLLTLNFTKLVSIFAPICPLWFLISLFFMRIVTAISKFIPLILIIISFVLFYTLETPQNYNNFMFMTTLLCYPYFYTGIIAKKFNLINKVCNLIKATSIWIKLITLLMTFIILTIVGLTNGKTDMVQCNYGESGWIFFPISFLLCAIIIIYCYFFLNKNNGIIVHISSGTMMILAIHFPIISFIKNIIPLNSFLDRFIIITVH